MRRLLRALRTLGLLGALVATAYKLAQRRRPRPGTDATSAPWPPLTVPDDAAPVVVDDTPAPSPAVEEAAVASLPLVWVEPEGDVCPPSHPVKAKLSSGVFHLPGMMHYDRTKPDRCYPDAAAAEADGLRQAKR